jgi:CBS domain-containing protein
VVVPKRDSSAVLVRDVMTSEVVCGHLDSSVDEVRTLMKERKFRHLPIVDFAGNLCGMISIGDVNAHETSNKEMTIHLLEEYIHSHAE